MYGGIQILPPYQIGFEWYFCTANSIFQNTNFIDQYSPEYVLILSGDHIYKMDYSLMIDFHKRMDADCTISVIDVPIKEASLRDFKLDDSGRIIDFKRNQKYQSTQASMGIYVFKWNKFKSILK